MGKLSDFNQMMKRAAWHPPTIVPRLVSKPTFIEKFLSIFYIKPFMFPQQPIFLTQKHRHKDTTVAERRTSKPPSHKKEELHHKEESHFRNSTVFCFLRGATFRNAKSARLSSFPHRDIKKVFRGSSVVTLGS